MVIPIADLNPARRTPWVTRGLLLANLGVFLFVQPWLEGVCAHQQFLLRWAAVPAEIARGAALTAADLGAGPLAACGLQPVADKAVYGALLSSMFLHADVLHLLGNMLYLWIFGNNIEDRFGHVRFLAFYLSAGLVAALAYVVANSQAEIVLVGASGAIAGVLGAYLVLFPTARVTVLVVPLLFLAFQLPAVIVLGLWFVLQLRDMGGAAVGGGGVAYLAHVAGFVLGVVVTVLGGGRPQRLPDPRRHRREHRRGR